jgi:uncharacterized protein with FMN-binding domain
MKKTSLSILLITIFAAYAIFQRMVASSSPMLAPAAVSDSQTNSTPAPAQTNTTSTSPVPAQTPAGGSTPPSPTPAPAPAPAPKPKGLYTDGSYTGVSADAYYGYIQVRAVISGGKLTNVVFLQYPNDRGTSIEINSQAMPYLKQEAIAAQSANVNIISGATDSSYAFRQSLSSALAQAKS